MSLQLTVMSLDFDAFSGPTTKKFNKNEIFLGRSGKNDLVLDNVDVSQKHAKLKVVKDSETGKPALLVVDLGSTNGTHVRNTRLAPKEEVQVALNERIRIGNFLIKPTYVNDDEEDLEEVSDDIAPISEGKIIRMPVMLETKQEIEMDNSFDEEILADQAVGGSAHAQPARILEEPAFIAAPMPEVRPQAQLRLVESQQRAGSSAIIRGRVSAGHVEDLNFIAKQLLSLRGKVLHKGKPLSGVSINAGPLGTAVSDAEGNFEFHEIAEGSSYNLTAFKADFIFTAEATSGVLERDAEISFSATQLFSIRGIVSHNGKPLAGAEVDGGKLGKTVTGADGSYVFADVPEDTDFTIQVLKGGYIISAA